MNTNATQELLPPVSEEPTGASGWFGWLTDPLPQRFMLPATGLLVMGLDWLLFSQEAATLGLTHSDDLHRRFPGGQPRHYLLQRKYGLDTRPAAG